ncbi:MAG: hypothetical protein M3O46_13410 [Myxococcota bacterium]|nr:hypothetical protein [Myxococcota bacterium]
MPASRPVGGDVSPEAAASSAVRDEPSASTGGVCGDGGEELPHAGAQMTASA